jgi:uncharacterized protein YjbI with pentapeptide repeats
VPESEAVPASADEGAELADGKQPADVDADVNRADLDSVDGPPIVPTVQAATSTHPTAKALHTADERRRKRRRKFGRAVTKWVGLAVAVLTVFGALVFNGCQAQGVARQLDLSEKGLNTGRYSTAVEQLGSPSAEVRLGAIYALERLMKDFKDYQPTIMEVLSAFIRNSIGDRTVPTKTTRPVRPPIDVLAAITVLGRRDVRQDAGRKVDLSQINFSLYDLTNANLSGMNLSLTILSGTILSHAKLGDAILAGAVLTQANLSDADLSDAHLDQAVLIGANLSAANLSRASISGANLTGANLTHAILRSANFSAPLASGNPILNGAAPTGANLAGANFTDADLTGANLTGAIRTGAIFTGAILTGAIGM